ncbi:MAG: two-component system response regulator [Candidatus Omnitrophota bacterium]|nr:MAG: two-component system response regulator [Candidatus Omnitrophota bacterium]
MVKKRVLIVDDIPLMCNLIKSILTEAGYEVCGEAGDVVEGIEKYKQLRPDLVTWDIIMPKKEDFGGVEGIKEILSFDPQAKIIIVSALRERKTIQEALSWGAKEYIIKPFTKDELLAAVRKVLREKGGV